MSLIGCDADGNTAEDRRRLNVLFIAVDDLRNELNCYGAAHIKSPSFDRLADQGMIFNNAYCMQAVCAPSRNSMMTGLRPDAIGIYDLYTFFRKKVPDVITLPQHFKAHGYHTEGMGKIYHTGHGNENDTLSWSIPHWSPGREIAKLQKINRGDTVGLERDFPMIEGKKLPWYRSQTPEKQMTDAMVTAHAVERLAQLKDSAFFLAVGFVKPHLPFVAPARYWDMYDPASIEFPPASPPQGMPEVALHNFGELRKYHGIQAEGLLNEAQSRNMIHGYYACVSYIDAQLGTLLDALKDNDLEQNTIVVLWGDHGWKLGDYGSWCKHTNFEMDTRAPLFITVPGMRHAGTSTEALTEFIDLYPTLCDLAGLPTPAQLQGTSLVPVLEDPDKEVNSVAISQYPRGKSLGYDRKSEFMGYSMRTGKYRFTRWQLYEHPDSVIAVELYDVGATRAANRNLAVDPEFQDEVERLHGLLDGELARHRQEEGNISKLVRLQ
jgi:arylsulfatase A-like enzyme